MPSLSRACAMLIKRDLLLAYRHRGELLQPPLFFVIVVSLFPLAIRPEAEMLRALAPAVIWVAALLATLLSLENLFRSDFDDGALEQLLLSPHPTSALVFAKILAHWLVTGLPLLIVSPVLGIVLDLPGRGLAMLAITLALGTPVLSLVGSIGVALTVGLRRGGAFLSLLVLPLYVPVLIFGANAVDAAAAGVEVAVQLYLLGAMLALALVLAPVGAGAALRISVD